MKLEDLKKIKKVEYKGAESTDPLSFKFYDANKMVLGKPMKEHLKFAMSYWHTLCAEGVDIFGSKTGDKTFGETDPLEIFKRKAEFGFEFMDKLGIDYYCFHDVDIAPEGKTFKETMKYFNLMVDYLADLQKKYNKKLLWGTANNFGNRMFMRGAATSPDANAFAMAGAKVKAGIDATIKLGGTGYVFWGGREGYETLLNTDVKKELDNMATFLKVSRDYGRKQGFKGVFMIEPKPKEPSKHQYDFDVQTTIGFLEHYGLEKDFKVNIESNHATLAGHTFEHEIRMAAIRGMLGSIDANDGDVLLGWDTDHFPSDVRSATLAMYEILKAGGLDKGGINFDAKTRRPSNTLEDLLYAYILGMDTYALGLLKAAALIEDKRLSDFVDNHYRSYNEGIGAKITNGTVTMEELFEHALKNDHFEVESGRQEYLESILNNILFR